MTIIGNIKGSDNDSNGAAAKTQIESVYVCNEADISLDYGAFKEKEEYADVSFVADNSGSYEDAVESLKNDPKRKDLVIRILYDSEEGFDVDMVSSDKADLGKADLESFEEAFSEFLREEVLKTAGVSSEEYDYMSRDIEVKVMKVSKDGTIVEDTGSISLDDYGMMLGGLIILFLFVNMAAGNVATSVATEKSSRVIEYLLTGTRPLALLAGKIAARILETVITTFASYSCFSMSQIVCAILMADTTVSEGASNNVIMVASIWETITLSKLIVAVVYFALGLCLYTIIGALTGASVSKFDELQDAYKMFSLVLVVCAYTDMFLVIMMLVSGETEGLMNFCALFPPMGAFLTPTLILTGKISLMTGIIALILMVIAVIVIAVLAAAVYESMLLFQGKRLQAKDVIALMKKQVVT